MDEDESSDIDVNVDDVDDNADDDVVIVSFDPSLGTGGVPIPISIKTEDILTGLEKFTSNVRNSISSIFLIAPTLEILKIEFIFNWQDNGDRYYINSEMTLRASVVDTLSMWNMDWNNKEHDFLFVQFLLIEIFGGGRTLALKQLDDQKLRFINDIFTYRVKNDGNRLTTFEDLVNKVIDQFSKKMMEADNTF